MKEIKDAGNPNSPLYIIGEAPGEEEEREGSPFVGPSGKLLFEVLRTYGVERKDVFVSNCSLFRPPGNDFKKVNPLHLKENVNRLQALAIEHKPNCIFVLGNNALSSFSPYSGITNWRGSILERSGIKLIPAYHPAAVLREPAIYPIFAFDVHKAIEESKNSNFNYPIIDYQISPLSPPNFPTYSVDIETTKKDKELRCIGFGFEDKAFVYPFISKHDNDIRNLLASSSKKIFHNGVFDVNVLKMKGYEVNGYEEDTIVQAHILQPELPRSLAYLTSIYTRQPYYKSTSSNDGDEKSWGSTRTLDELLIYNAKDVFVTYQIWKEQDKEIKEQGLVDLYRYEMEATLAAIEMAQNGLLVDLERVEILRNIVDSKVKQAQADLNKVAGGYSINARSPKDVPLLLFKVFGLPERKNRTGNITTDEDALISLIGHCQSQLNYCAKKDEVRYLSGLVACKLLLGIRGWLKLQSSYLNIKLGHDNRARSTFKPHATETGRWSASLFVDGSGCNLQTIPRESIEK